MKRKKLIFVLCLFSVLLISGCSDKDDSEEQVFDLTGKWVVVNSDDSIVIDSLSIGKINADNQARFHAMICGEGMDGIIVYNKDTKRGEFVNVGHYLDMNLDFPGGIIRFEHVHILLKDIYKDNDKIIIYRYIDYIERTGVNLTDPMPQPSIVMRRL